MTTLISGITGQDGSYIAEQLVADGQQPLGVVHPHQQLPDYIAALQRSGKVHLLSCNLTDTVAWRRLLRETRPHRVFHLAAISAPREVAADIEPARRINVDSVEALLEWIRREAAGTRVLVCSSAAIFGQPDSDKQSESTTPAPRDEYGRQKLIVRELAARARAAGLFAACAIPFNHESPRREESFVMAKVCRAAARMARGSTETLQLGNVRSRRDWGYAPEYCAAMRAMLVADTPLELVLATGEAHSVNELVEAAFAYAGIDPRGRVTTDFALARPGDYDLVGDATLAAETLGWRAQVRFAELIRLLVDAALAEGK